MPGFLLSGVNKMAWDGSGSFNRTNGVNTGIATWTDDKNAGTKILSTRHDTHDQDLADGIESCLAKNGENAATADLDAGGYKITNAADGTADTDLATKGQIAGLDSHGVIAPHKNLVIVNNTTNPTYQIDINVSAVVLTDATPKMLMVSSVDLTVDVTASGANGLDTGSEANSTWYHLWVIRNASGTVAGLLSTSATAPTMPSGYTYKGYVGAVYNDSGGDFIVMHQKNTRVSCEVFAIASGATETSITSLAAQIPTTAATVMGYCGASVIGGTVAGASLYSDADGSGKTTMSVTASTGNNATTSPFIIPIHTAQTIYYTAFAGSTVAITGSGWEY